MTQKMTDLVKQIVAILMAFMLFLGTLGYTFEQFNTSTIESFGLFLTAMIPFGVTVYGIYTNTFAGRKAFAKAHEKEAQRLIEEGEFDPEAGAFVEREVEAPEGVEDGADIK